MSGTKRAANHGDEASGGEKRQRASLEAAASSLKCSITTNLMVDPVATADGQIYERSAIQRWLEKHDTSPNTGARLDHKKLTALPAVRATIQHLVDSGSLAPSEMSQWLLQKGIASAGARNWADAKRLLLRAYELGQTVAGYHLGRAWIEEAAEADVSEAVQEVQRRAVANTGAPAAEQDLPPITSPSEIAPGDRVRVLSEDRIRAACAALPADLGMNPEEFEDVSGQTMTVEMVDDDMTIFTDAGFWIPMAACAKLASAGSPVAYSSISDVALRDKVHLVGEAECMAAFAADGLEYRAALHPDRRLFVVCEVQRPQLRVLLMPTDISNDYTVPFGAIAGRHRVPGTPA